MSETMLRKEVTLPNSDIVSLEEKSGKGLTLSINHEGTVISCDLTISDFDHMMREFLAVRQSAAVQS
jgi:hypothetical protein